MTKKAEPKKRYDGSVGVIVGRFQTPFLHAGHRMLIETALEECDSVIILIGVCKAQATNTNPLTYVLRQNMILDVYPDVHVTEIVDQPDDTKWTEDLHNILKSKYAKRSYVLYGSRDSFLAMYSGPLPHRYVEALPAFAGSVSATAIRDRFVDVEYALSVASNAESFRAGVVYANVSRFPTSYQAVDLVVRSTFRNTGRAVEHILLGMKTIHNGKYCFPGGFVDPACDDSLESAAIRELAEETGISVLDPKYVTSCKVPDYRYKNTQDKIMTAIYSAVVSEDMSMTAVASDDLESLSWIPIDAVSYVLAPSHIPVWNAYLNSIT